MRDRRAVLLVLAVVAVAGVAAWWAVGRPGQDHAPAVARWQAPAPGEAAWLSTTTELRPNFQTLTPSTVELAVGLTTSSPIPA